MLDFCLVFLKATPAVILAVLGLLLPWIRVQVSSIEEKANFFAGTVCILAISQILVTVYSNFESENEKNMLNSQLESSQITLDRIFEKISEDSMEQEVEVADTTPPPEPTSDVTITKPEPESNIQLKAQIAGSVSNLNAPVSLIVHPVGTDNYWVQPSVTLHEGGKWTGSAYFGRAGKIDIGKEFKVMAVQDPDQELAPGDILFQWPDADGRSEIISVVRGI